MRFALCLVSVLLMCLIFLFGPMGFECLIVGWLSGLDVRTSSCFNVGSIPPLKLLLGRGVVLCFVWCYCVAYVLVVLFGPMGLKCLIVGLFSGLGV